VTRNRSNNHITLHSIHIVRKLENVIVHRLPLTLNDKKISFKKWTQKNFSEWFEENKKRNKNFVIESLGFEITYTFCACFCPRTSAIARATEGFSATFKTLILLDISKSKITAKYQTLPTFFKVTKYYQWQMLCSLTLSLSSEVDSLRQKKKAPSSTRDKFFCIQNIVSEIETF
jgi:hypothetical protein